MCEGCAVSVHEHTARKKMKLELIVHIQPLLEPVTHPRTDKQVAGGNLNNSIC